MKVTKNSIKGKPYKGAFVVVREHVDDDYSCLYDYCKGLRSYIEIGTAHGMSACVAGFAVTGDVHTIDPFRFKKSWKRKGDPVKIVTTNWKNMGHDPARWHVHEHATPPLPPAAKGTFDVGLIDGKHWPFSHVMSDFELLSPRITKYLLIHDLHEDYKHPYPKFLFDWVIEHDPDWEFETIRGCMGVLKRHAG